MNKFFLCLFFTVTIAVNAQDNKRIIINPESRDNPNFKWFAEARFGMFIHFSLATLFDDPGELHYMANFINNNIGTYKDYEANVKRFNPSKFSAKAWVDVAESAGCKYIVFVAKHTEGFCNWDTKTTDFKITNTPFRRDILKELADECHLRGMHLGVYLNPNEWHSPYKPNLPGNKYDRNWKRDNDEPNWEKHTKYIEMQLTEILTNYGPIDLIWFDCTFHQENHVQGKRLYKLIKSIQPNCLVNDRTKYGDFLTPEGDLNETLNSEDYLIEQCATIGNYFGYLSDDKYKSMDVLLGWLVRTAGCGSNFLLNVGPKADGMIPEPQVERMKAIGTWLKVNGNAIYGTSDVQLPNRSDDIRITRSGNNLFIILLKWPSMEYFRISGIQTDPVSARLLGGGVLNAQRINNVLEVTGLPPMPSDNLPKVVHLHFDKVPVVEKLARPVKIEYVIPVVSIGRTSLPVTQASLEGFTVKGWRHSVRSLTPPDAAYEQKSNDLPFDMYERNTPNTSVQQIKAIVNWCWLEQSTVWNVETEKPLKVRIRICMRCPEAVGGSKYEIRVADQKIEAKVIGSGPMQKGVSYPITSKGFANLPFTWKEVGEINLPAGRCRIEMQPTDIVWGAIFMDLLGLELIAE